MSGTGVTIIHPGRLIRESLASALSRTADLKIVGVFGDSNDLLDLDDVQPHVIVLDLHLPERRGLREASRIRSFDTRSRILMFGLPNLEADILAAIEAGASGYVLQDGSLQDLVDNIRAVAAGEAICPPKLAAILFSRLAKNACDRNRQRDDGMAHLTPRELEIIALIDAGLSNKEIAARSKIEVQTVKNHVHNILEKLHLPSRREAARYARETGLLTPGVQRGTSTYPPPGSVKY